MWHVLAARSEMIFGRFFRDAGLKRQKSALAATQRRIAELEQRLPKVASLREHCAAGWDEEQFAGLASKVGKLKEIADLLAQRAGNARQELPKFDDSVSFVDQNV